MVLPEELKNKIRSGTAPKRRARERTRHYRRALATVAAVLLVGVFGLSVAAAFVPGFDWFISRMGEDMRSMVSPVERGVVSEGIRMDVLAAVNDDDSAIVYLSLADEEQQRINEGTELFWMDTGEDSHCWGPQVDYDEETGTAIYRLEVQGHQPIEGETLTLTLHSILTDVAEQPLQNTGLTVADIQAANPLPATEAVSYDDGGGYSMTIGEGEGGELAAAALADSYDAGTLPLLVPYSAPMEGAWPQWLNITAAGVVDGNLLLQYEPSSEAAAYSHTWFGLEWPGHAAEEYGPNALTTASFSRGEVRSEGFHQINTLSEEVVILPEGVALEEMQIVAGGTTCSAHIAGNWQVELQLENVSESLVAQMDMEMGGWTLQTLEVSSINAKAIGHGDMNLDSQSADIEVWLLDGTVVGSDSATTLSDSSGAISMRSNFNRPIELSLVERVTLNGIDVPVHLVTHQP